MLPNHSLSIMTNVMLNNFQFYALRQVTTDDLSPTDDNLKDNKYIRSHQFIFHELKYVIIQTE